MCEISCAYKSGTFIFLPVAKGLRCSSGGGNQYQSNCPFMTASEIKFLGGFVNVLRKIITNKRKKNSLQYSIDFLSPRKNHDKSASYRCKNWIQNEYKLDTKLGYKNKTQNGTTHCSTGQHIKYQRGARLSNIYLSQYSCIKYLLERDGKDTTKLQAFPRYLHACAH